MKLRGVEFGKVWGASGVQGFFGEGYWFHSHLKRFGLDFTGMTFVAKTTTLLENKGNMKLNPDFTPKDLFPDCIYVGVRGFLKGAALNAVGLSGPGIVPLLLRWEWQRIDAPFFLSFMSIAKTRGERLGELAGFVEILKQYLPPFKAPVGLQINFSCPNVGLDVHELADEVKEGLCIAAPLGIPLVPKFNLRFPVEAAAEICELDSCDAICISNALPYTDLSREVKRRYFGEIPPLQKYGGGGFSGTYLFPLLLQWLRKARKAGLTKPINAGGGILSLLDAKKVLGSGADSIFLGSIAFLRPWRVRRIIKSCG